MDDVETTIGTPLDVVLPRHTAVGLSTNTGVPLLEVSGRDPVSRGLQTLLGRLLPEQPETARSSSLLGRLRGGAR
jgi:pilus assembly protein CpaE